MYMRCAEWRDHGILADLSRYHGLESPDFDLLECIAHAVAAVVHLSPPRLNNRRFDQETRTKLLVGWFNYHYAVIGRHTRNLVLQMESGETLGPQADAFTNWAIDHPDSAVINYLRNDARSIQ
jgi:hypothetical protein